MSRNTRDTAKLLRATHYVRRAGCSIFRERTGPSEEALVNDIWDSARTIVVEISS